MSVAPVARRPSDHARKCCWQTRASPLAAGMASDAVLRRLQRIGQGSISADQGLLSLTIILRGPAAAHGVPALPQLAVNAFVWGTYLKGSQPQFFAEMALAHLPEHWAKIAGVGGARRSAPAVTQAIVDPLAMRGLVKTEVLAAIVQVSKHLRRKHMVLSCSH